MIDPSGDDAESFRREVDAAEGAKSPPPPPTVAELAARVTAIERELAEMQMALSVLAL